MKDILDLHTHTIASGHAYNTIYEMAKSASDKGLELLGISEHTPAMPGSCHPIYFLNLRTVPRQLYGIKLLLGCEHNIMDYEGTVDLKPSFCKSVDYGIASIHEPCYRSGSIVQNTDAYINAMKNPHVHIIGHPDDGRFPFDYEAVVKEAKKQHVLLEVNTSSLHPNSSRLNARENYITMLNYCSKYEVSIIINSDAHCEVDVANHTAAWNLIEQVNFPTALIVNDSLEKLASYIPILTTQE